MRLSSSEIEMTRPFADPHPGHVLSDVVLPRRVAFSQSMHSKNFGSILRPMATASRTRFLLFPGSGSIHALSTREQSLLLAIGIKRADVGFIQRRQLWPIN